MHRFYAETLNGDLATLAAGEAYHAARVLRLRPGDEVELLRDGRRCRAVLMALSEQAGTLRVTGELPSTEAGLRVTLFQGLPKADKLEWIVQKAVELGAEAVVPVAMSRSVTKLSAADGQKKQARWQKIADEACKQSGRCQAMRVEAPLPFAGLPARLAAMEAAIVPWEEAESRSLTALRAERPALRELAVVIGPEGGISREEIAAMQAAGALPLTLGPRILRTETAAIATLAAVMCLYGEME